MGISVWYENLGNSNGRFVHEIRDRTAVFNIRIAARVFVPFLSLAPHIPRNDTRV
jgi:hypothetical protein